MANIKNNYTAVTDPQTTDDLSSGYGVGSTWFNSASCIQWRCRDATTGAADWVMVSIPDSWPSQTYKLPTQGGISSSALTTTTDLISFVPIPIRSRVTVDTIAMAVNALSAGAAFRVGLYASDIVTGKPVKLVPSSTATFDADTTTGSIGAKGAMINLTLNPGLYWGACYIKGVASPATVARVSNGLGDYIAQSNLGSLTPSVNIRKYLQASGTAAGNAISYANGLPAALFPSDTTPGSSTDGVIVALRRA